MKTLRTQVCHARLPGFAFAILLLASAFTPAQVGAHDGHEQSNVIANAGGESVRLRSGPSTLDRENGRFPEGTAVEVVDGPHTANDGGIWRQVSIAGQNGYMDSDFLIAIDVAVDRGGVGGPGIVSGTATTNDAVNLRTGPSLADPAIATLAAGEMVTLTGANRNGWNSVSADAGDGWVLADFLDFGSSTRVVDAAAPTASAQTADPASGFTVAPETRFTLNEVHLRSGPGTAFDSIAIMEPGVQLEMTGAQESGFVEVMSPSGEGWVSAQYIGESPPDVPAVPEPDVPALPDPVEVEAPVEPVVAFANANVNLRTGSSQASTAISVIASGAEVELSGVTENGFAQVATTAGSGWISSEFLSESQPQAPAAQAPSNSLIAWPVSGGEWFVSQGYNGSSHQNRGDLWQYYYSLDLKRSDGNTANQPIYAPVAGAVRWIDEATGGMSISMGNGLAYAMFHANFDPSIQEGDVLTQGQYMGVVSPPGEGANGGNPHLHITVWSTTDEGNWSRNAIPFTGNVAIAGIEFPETGTGNDYRGYTFNP